MSKRVNLFVPCLVDQLYPEIAFSAFQLLRHFDYSVSYYEDAVCCGQPAFNSGQRSEARKVARHFVDTVSFDDAPLVCPSGSCSAMVGKFYPELFAGSDDGGLAARTSNRAIEFSAFLCRENLLERIDGETAKRVGFHNSCHSYRELGIRGEPFELLSRIRGVEWIELGEPVCCGFGGLFSIKLPSLAGAMAKSRLEPFVEAGVETLVSNDPGCIMHLRKESEALGLSLEVVHLTEFLARAMGLPTDTLEVRG